MMKWTYLAQIPGRGHMDICSLLSGSLTGATSHTRAQNKCPDDIEAHTSLGHSGDSGDSVEMYGAA